MICRARGHRACEAGPMRRTRRRPRTTEIAAVVSRRTMRAVIGIARLRGPRTSRAEASGLRIARGRVKGMAIGRGIGTGTGIETNREIAPSARGGTTMMHLGGRITTNLRPDVQADDPVAVQTDGPNVMTETQNMKSLSRTRRVDEARTERERMVHDTTTETTLRESQNRLYEGADRHLHLLHLRLPRPLKSRHRPNRIFHRPGRRSCPRWIGTFSLTMTQGWTWAMCRRTGRCLPWDGTTCWR